MIRVMMKRGNTMRNNQQGMASFMVTTVLILVIGLMLTGFSQVARRNQRESLDRQLSSQAFYAAESGVNAAVSVIKSKAANGELPPPKTSCAPDTTLYPDVRLNDPDVKVTCMLVSTEINSLYYMAVTESSPTVVPIISAGQPISQITLKWENKDGSTATNCLGGGFSARTSWNCGFGVLRTDLAPTPTGDVNAIAMSTFFNPLKKPSVDQNSAPAVSYGSRGGLVSGYCADAGGSKCMAKITNLGGLTYYMNLRSIYKDSAVTITGQDAAGNDVKLIGQAVIDVTAKAQDVLRRIQVRVPLESRASSTIPAYAIQSKDSICKRFSVEPGYYNADPVCN